MSAEILSSSIVILRLFVQIVNINLYGAFPQAIGAEQLIPFHAIKGFPFVAQ
jgi:hypothetical protein